MVVFMSTEGHTDGGVELRDTPSCMRSEASAVLNYLPSEVLPGSSLADGYASIAGAHGRSVRHCLLLVCTGLEARTVGVVSLTSARTWQQFIATVSSKRCQAPHTVSTAHATLTPSYLRTGTDLLPPERVNNSVHSRYQRTSIVSPQNITCILSRKRHLPPFRRAFFLAWHTQCSTSDVACFRGGRAAGLPTYRSLPSCVRVR